MSSSKLKVKSKAIIAAFVMLSFVVACNDSDKSEKNSPTADSVNAAKTDTSSATLPPVKKVGKASITVMTEDKSNKIERDKMGYYNRTEVLPEYPGGQNDLQNYVSSKIEYPEDAINNNIEGTVHVQFAIDEQGNVSNARTIGNKIGYGLEEESIKLVSNMPKWTPGMVKGKKVKAWYTLPVTYKLEG